MRHIVFFGLGIGFMLMGVALFLLAMRKPSKPTRAMPNKSELREQAVLAEESKKLRIAAAGIGGLGLLILVLSQI